MGVGIFGGGIASVLGGQVGNPGSDPAVGLPPGQGALPVNIGVGGPQIFISTAGMDNSIVDFLLTQPASTLNAAQQNFIRSFQVAAPAPPPPPPPPPVPVAVSPIVNAIQPAAPPPPIVPVAVVAPVQPVQVAVAPAPTVVQPVPQPAPVQQVIPTTPQPPPPPPPPPPAPVVTIVTQPPPAPTPPPPPAPIPPVVAQPIAPVAQPAPLFGETVGAILGGVSGAISSGGAGVIPGAIAGAQLGGAVQRVVSTTPVRTGLAIAQQAIQSLLPSPTAQQQCPPGQTFDPNTEQCVNQITTTIFPLPSSGGQGHVGFTDPPVAFGLLGGAPTPIFPVNPECSQCKQGSGPIFDEETF